MDIFQNKEQFVKGIVSMAYDNIDEEVSGFIKGFKASNFEGKAGVNIYLTSFYTPLPHPQMCQLAKEMMTMEVPEIEEKLAKDYPEVIFENPRLFLSFDELNQCWHINLLVCVELKK